MVTRVTAASAASLALNASAASLAGLCGPAPQDGRALDPRRYRDVQRPQRCPPAAPRCPPRSDARALTA
eukprot:1784449-Prymnesium_polylepis.1